MDDWIVGEYPDVIRVIAVKPLTDLKVRVKFSDHSERDIDLEQYLQGPIFEPIRHSPEMFRRIYIDHGAIAWPNGADVDTDTLYYGDTPPPWANDASTLAEHLAPSA